MITFLGWKDLLVRQEKMVKRELKVIQEFLVLLDLRDHVAFRDYVDLQALRWKLDKGVEIKKIGTENSSDIHNQIASRLTFYDH